jgi:polysaccharide biosynthesis transport protein
MEKSVVTLQSVLKRRGLPALLTFAAVMGGSIAYLSVAPRVYETSARLMLDEKRVSVSELGRDLTQVPNVVPGGASPLADQAELVKSEQVLEKALAKVKLESGESSIPKGLTLKGLKRDLKVKIIPGTNILEVNYNTPNRLFGVKLVNALSQAMVEENIKTISSQATKVREFLEKNEVPNAQQRLRQADVAENQYRQASGIVSFDEQSKTLVTSLGALEDQERTLLAQLQEARARDASLRQVTNSSSVKDAYTAVRSGQSEQAKLLRGKLTELETQIVAKQQRYTVAHPELVSLLRQRQILQIMYQQELALVGNGNGGTASTPIADDNISQTYNNQLVANTVDAVAVANKLQSLQAQRGALQARLAQLPIKQQPLTALTRTREEAAESVKILQRKLEEAKIAEAQKVSNLRVIEAAKLAILPASPQIPVVLLVAGVLGTLMASGVALILEAIDNRLHDADEAEAWLELPLLGVLPRLPGSNLALAPGDSFLDNTGLVEPYRMLLKSLEYRSIDNPRVIVVSSAISGEGKSVVVSRLAAVAGMLSRRTLIIDADLRRPMQHHLFNLPATPGITDAVAGRLHLREAAQPTAIENLSVLTCGTAHARPSQFLESAAMKALMAQAADEYDLVIVDTPPLNACADATTLSQYGDGIMLVTRPSITRKEVLQKAVTDLKRDRISVLGVIVNGITTATDRYYRDTNDSYPVASRGLAKLGSGSRTK